MMTEPNNIEGNPRGIPKAPFIEDVATFIKPDQAEATLEKFNEMIGKFKYMETHLGRRKQSLTSKIPEISQSSDMVNYIIAKKDGAPLDVTFELAETLYAKARVPLPSSVNLWLGANVMLEYPVQEASDLLNGKLDAAKLSLKQVEEDLEYLREQITTMEVNIARVYNYDVKNRRDMKAKE